MITSAAQGHWPLDVPISDLHRGGLSHACVVRVSKVTTLDARLATRIGDLAMSERAQVSACLAELPGNALAG